MTGEATAEPAAPQFATPWQTAERFVTLNEILEAGRASLGAEILNFVEGGSGDEWTLVQNRRSFQRWQFRPRVLTGISLPDTTTTFLGIRISMPIITAPFGFDSAIHPEGHLAVARGAARAGTTMIVPVVSTFPLEEVRSVAPAAATIFQLVAGGSDATFLRLAGRALEAGYQALCITVDTFVAGWRERSMEDRYSPDPRILMGNLAGHELGEVAGSGVPEWTWDRVAKLCRQVGLPWAAKGVLSGDDGRAAVDAGAAAVIVSNHGGRQLEGAPAPLDKLAEMVDAVGPDAEVGLDGGIRRGSDVAKALALGARAVGVGRVIAFALAAAGEDGVHRALELLQQELVTTMALAGRASISDIDGSLVEPAPS